ncbi:MAG: HNH endonuclease [Spirochaetales bacterium]|nr:HNH endonuclease [Spirochaetales bacterium]
MYNDKQHSPENCVRLCFHCHRKKSKAQPVKSSKFVFSFLSLLMMRIINKYNLIHNHAVIKICLCMKISHLFS